MVEQKAYVDLRLIFNVVQGENSKDERPLDLKLQSPRSPRKQVV